MFQRTTIVSTRSQAKQGLTAKAPLKSKAELVAAVDDENKLSKTAATSLAAAGTRKRRALGDVGNQIAAASAEELNKATKTAKPIAVKTKPVTRTSLGRDTRSKASLEKKNEENKAPEVNNNNTEEAHKRQKTEDAKLKVSAKEACDWEDLDACDAEDPMMVSEYVVEIFEYLRELEVKMLPDPNYMVKQKEIQWNMRGILIDWLVEVHQKFRLLPETIFLAVNIIDRFMSLRSVKVDKLQLIGITSLFIASKFEEVFAPSISQFSYIADGGYSNEEIIAAERNILQVLEFNLQFPNHLNFLRRISKADDYDIHTRTMGKYLMEVTLIDETFLSDPPSLVAAAAMYISRKTANNGNTEWTPNLVRYSGYMEMELKSCVTKMICYLHKERTHQAIFKKYSTDKNRHVARYVELWMKKCVEARKFNMPFL